VKGEITVRFSVTSEGKTTGIKIVKNTLNNINIERCIVQKIRDWQDFPRVHNSESDLVMEKTYSF
jgi:outer membrane biosynthesis protein TonB